MTDLEGELALRSTLGKMGPRPLHVISAGTAPVAERACRGGTRCHSVTRRAEGYAATGRYSWMSPPRASWRSTGEACWSLRRAPAHRHAEVKAAVRPLLVVVAEVLAEDSFEVAAPEHQSPVEALNAGRPHEPLCEGVRQGCQLQVMRTVRPEPSG